MRRRRSIMGALTQCEANPSDVSDSYLAYRRSQGQSWGRTFTKMLESGYQSVLTILSQIDQWIESVEASFQVQNEVLRKWRPSVLWKVSYVLKPSITLNNPSDREQCQKVFCCLPNGSLGGSWQESSRSRWTGKPGWNKGHCMFKSWKNLLDNQDAWQICDNGKLMGRQRSTREHLRRHLFILNQETHMGEEFLPSLTSLALPFCFVWSSLHFYPAFPPINLGESIFFPPPFYPHNFPMKEVKQRDVSHHLQSCATEQEFESGSPLSEINTLATTQHCFCMQRAYLFCM